MALVMAKCTSESTPHHTAALDDSPDPQVERSAMMSLNGRMLVRLPSSIIHAFGWILMISFSISATIVGHLVETRVTKPLIVG